MDQPHDRRAVLLDPHPLWLEAVEGVLSNAEVSVIGKATAPDEALRLVEERRPDLFIVEIEARSSQLDGIACMRLAREACPELKLLVLSGQDDQHRIEAAFAAGAVAYIVKTARADDLGAAIRQAFEPSVYFSHTIHHETSVPSATRNGSRNGSGSNRRDSNALTRREIEILQLVAEGYSSSVLAQMLWITEQTVKFHLSNIYRKIGVSNRTEASRWAQLHGLLSARSAGSSG
jgi:DNA-binding NarL/FixJ family response regulator